MAFTPEQIAKAYMGAQGDIYDVFKNQAAMEATQNAYAAAQRKQQLDLERKERAERNASVNDLLAAQKANNLATGSQLDRLWNTKSQEVINRAMSKEGMELYQSNPALFKANYVSELHQIGDNMKSVQAGVKKVDEYLKNIYDKTGGALNVSAARNAIINTIGLDENGNPRDSFNAEDANIMGVLEGTFDPLTHQNVEDPKKRAVIAANYFNPEKIRENVIRFKPAGEMKEDYVSSEGSDGIKVNQLYKIPSYYVKTPKGFALDVQEVKGKDNESYPLATDNLISVISKVPYPKVAIANHEKDLLETKQGQKAFQALDDEQWNKYVVADLAQLLPRPEKLGVPALDAKDKELYERQQDALRRKSESGSKGHLSNVRDYVNNPQAAIQDFPAVSLEEQNVIGAPAGVTELIRLDAGPQGSKELKTANGSKVNVYLDPNSGQSYMVYRPTLTMAGVIKNPEEAKIGGKDMTNRLIPIPTGKNEFWLSNFNYSQYGDKKEDFPLTGSRQTAQPQSTTTTNRKESLQFADEMFKDAPVNRKKSKK